MRGRQQVYPTFECAPNRARHARKIPRDMPIFGGSEWAYWAYVQWPREWVGHVPRGAGNAPVDMPIFHGSEWAYWAYVQWPRSGWGMSRGVAG